MAFPLSYCPDGAERVARLRKLHDERDQSIVLATMDVPSAAIAELVKRRPPGFCQYPDPTERARFWDSRLRERMAVSDDSIPSAYLTEMDQGLYGGLVGGEVHFLSIPEDGKVSSMVAPVLDDWSEFDDLKFDPRHPWFERYLRQLEVFWQAAEGKFGISHFILINGLNFLFELFGATRTYLDLIERPDDVSRAIDLAFEVNENVQSKFFEMAPLVEGGTCSNMMQWVPGKIISESVDPFHMTSVDYFERWGRGVLERIFARFDGGIVHIHGNGRHLLEAVSSVRGLRGILLGDDRGFPSAFEVLPEIRPRVGDLPLVADVQYGEFLRALDERRLTGGVLYRVNEVPDADTANRCMDCVREYRA